MNKHQCDYCCWYREFEGGFGLCEAPLRFKSKACEAAINKKELEELKFNRNETEKSIKSNS